MPSTGVDLLRVDAPDHEHSPSDMVIVEDLPSLPRLQPLVSSTNASLNVDVCHHHNWGRHLGCIVAKIGQFFASFGNVHRSSRGVVSRVGDQWNVGGGRDSSSGDGGGGNVVVQADERDSCASGDADGSDKGRIGGGGSDGGAGEKEAVMGSEPNKG